MAFDAKDKSVKELFSDNIFKIPINQRDYVWEEKQWNDLMNDILFANDNNQNHFIGSVVLEDNSKKEGIGYFTIIDGQQRTLSLIILLAALYHNYLDLDLLNEAEGIRKYLFATNVKNESSFVILNPIFGLKEMIEDVLKKKESFDFLWIEKQNGTKSNQNLFKAYNFFYRKIKERILKIDDLEQKNYISKILKTIIQLQYINIVADTEEDSFGIFEILNARGQELEDFELLKNYILKNSSNKELSKNRWDELIKNLTVNGSCNIKSFIKHYSMHKFESQNYKYPYDVIRSNFNKNEVDALIKDLIVKSNIYRRFLSPSEITDSELQKTIFEFFKRNRQTQLRPLIMSLIHNNSKGLLPDEILNTTLTYLKKFLICFTLISGEKSNKLENIIYKYSTLLENNFSIDTLNELILSLKTKFPSKPYFSKRLDSLGWSRRENSVFHSDKNKYNVKLILDLLEEYFGNLSIIEYTLEHIKSDDGTELNAKLGNILPLESNLNEKCNNKPYEEKILIYKDSSLKLPKKFIERYSLGTFDISKRHDYIVDLLFDNILKIS